MKFLQWMRRHLNKVIVMAVLVIVMVVAFTMAYSYGYDFMHNDRYANQQGLGKVVKIEIPEDITVKEIAQLLVDQGVLEDSTEFELKTRLYGASDFKFGVYYFQQGAKVEDIIETFKAGDQSDVVSISVIAGTTIDDLATQLESLGICEAQYFKKAVSSTSYDLDYLNAIKTGNDRRYALEGYMMPGLYRIIKDSSSKSVAKVFITEFDKKLTNALKNQVQESGFTLDEVVTLASVVQAECAVESDFPIYASMLLNRINSTDESLHCWEAPSTVLYAQMRSDDSLQSVTELDQAYDSPYNTFRYSDFPPGPICNPSVEAIKAVLMPAETNYFYCEIDVTNPDGPRHFSETLFEHEAYRNR